MAQPPVPEATRSQLEDAVARLRDLVPAGWSVEVASRTRDGGTLTLSSEQESGDIALLARKRLDPRDIAGLPETGEPTVIVSPWVSPRSRALLRARGLSFLDATGNAAITLSRPGLVIRTDGAARDPSPKPAVGPTLRGPRAWALLRTLIEVAPPYGVRDLADALQVDAGYVSRVLKVLEGELLIERRARGPIASVDWEGVLRQLATTYSVLGSNDSSTWVAAGGPGRFLADLAARPAGMWAVTGSFASSRIVPVAAPETAFLYASDPERVAKVGRLLPATTGSNVVLAVPYDEIIFERTRTSEKVPFVSTAQIAVDDLTGTGRMPEEGEALVAWMRRNLDRWQASSLTEPTRPDP